MICIKFAVICELSICAILPRKFLDIVLGKLGCANPVPSDL